MIYCVEGKVLEKNLQYVVLLNNGIGYRLNISTNTFKDIKEVGDTQFLYAYLNVREDAMELFGFGSKDEKQWFKLLTTVSGIGTKLSLSMLSDMPYNEIFNCILNDDHQSLTKCSGVGAKTAQRITLELKDKVKKAFIVPQNSIDKVYSVYDTNTNDKDAKDALISLGYSKQEVTSVISKLDITEETSEIVKKALKLLAKG